MKVGKKTYQFETHIVNVVVELLPENSMNLTRPFELLMSHFYRYNLVINDLS